MDFGKVYTKIWVDDWFAELDIKSKLVFVYLLTCQQSNWSRVFECPYRLIAFHTGLGLDEVKSILRQFEEADKVYYVSGYVIISNSLKYNQVNLNIKKTCIHEIESAPDSVKEHPACIDIYNYYLSDIKPKKLAKKPAVKPIEKPKEKPVKDMSALSDDAKVIYQYIQDNKISDRLTISLSDDALNSLCKEFDLEFMKEVVLTLYQHYNRHAHQKTVPYKDERLAIRKWVVKAVKQDGLLPIVNAEYERHKGNVLLKDDEYNMLLYMFINKDELSQFITKYSEYKRNRQDISLDHDADNLYDWIKRDKGRNN